MAYKAMKRVKILVAKDSMEPGSSAFDRALEKRKDFVFKDC